MSERWHHRESYTFDRSVIAEIRRAANTGVYRIRGFGAKRRLPTLDDLVLLGASMSRYPLEGYREACHTDVVIGERNAERPVHLEIPITIAGMSFGSLSAQAKEALGRGASAAGTSTTSGDGGMTQEERQHSKTLVYQYLPSRYGMNPDDLRAADAIEVVVGQGAKPGGGGMLMGQKVSARVAAMRTLPEGIDQRSACRHPDWTGPDDLTIKILELREIVDWQVPIYVKIGAARPYYDTALAVKAGADAVVVDGMRAARRPRRRCSSSTWGFPRSPPYRRRCGRSWSSTCIARYGSSQQVAFGRAPMSPRRSLWGPMPCRSGRPHSSRSVTTIRRATMTTGLSARPPGCGRTIRTGPIRPASPPRTPS